MSTQSRRGLLTAIIPFLILLPWAAACHPTARITAPPIGSAPSPAPPPAPASPPAGASGGTAPAAVQPAPAPAAPTPGPSRLAGTSWRLVEFQSSDDAIGTIKPSDPSKYTMTFGADGWVAMRLNCNRATGTWTSKAGEADSGALTFGPLGVTRMQCPEPSMDTRIARDTEHIVSYVLRNGRLFLALRMDGGIYQWEPADPPKP